MVYAVIALVGVAIGWLFASYQYAQQKAEQLAEREEMVAELSAAKQQITQSEHWRAECELLNNEVIRFTPKSSKIALQVSCYQLSRVKLTRER